jgi:endo-1,4-beta-mannosidase
MFDAYMDELGKPWFTEEFGWPQSVPEVERARRFEWAYEQQRSLESAGAAFWNLGPDVAGSSHDVNPWTPLTWDVVVANAPG